MNKTYTLEELETIQRECKIEYDLRSEQIRETIYQIKEFCLYILIRKERGEITQYRTAQNGLVLKLK